MRVCLVYDCLYPFTVGGAERWYRGLAERLAADGHQVTYLTLRQWQRGCAPGLGSVRVVVAGPSVELYARGRRRIVPPVVFGAGVLWHLLRHGGEYDIVHSAAFPYFSVLAAGLARRRAGYALFVDWHEVWTAEYWREYLGPAGGRLGWAVQRLCARIPQRAFCFSRLHARRLARADHGRLATVLGGEYDGDLEPRPPRPAEPVVVFAGRHIAEKRAGALVPALARARERLPDLTAEIYGDGPERPRIALAARRLGLEDAVALPGFVDAEALDGALRRALCMVLPSRREGYGRIVVEAAARGAPSVVVRGPDNAAVELVVDGENGVIAPSASAEDLAHAILRVDASGAALRRSTAAWFARNFERLSLAGSVARVEDAYHRDRRSSAPTEGDRGAP